MGYIYAYSPDEDDCSSLGLVGALMPTSCEATFEQGNFGEVTLVHPIDPYGKWACLTDGVILKMPVPVRRCPEIKSNGAYATTVETWTVDPYATADQRKVFKKVNNDKRLVTLPAGINVSVIETNFTYNRTRIKAWVTTGSGRKKKTKTYDGWIATDTLSSKVSESSIPATSAGAENENPSYAVQDQLFRIYQVTTTDSKGGQVTVKARRLVYDLLGNLSYYIDGGSAISGIKAGQSILEYTVHPHDFSLYSDVADTRSAIDCREKNPIEALIADETGVVSRWGAEITCDDFDIYMLHNAGLDRNVKIEYAKNMLGVTCDVNTSDVAVGIQPRGEDANGNFVYLTGGEALPAGYSFGTGAHDRQVIYRTDALYEDEAHTQKKFAVPKISPLAVSEAKVSKDMNIATARRRMVDAAIEEFEKLCYMPTITMTVNFVMLGDTDEYAQFRHLEPLFVYDTVHFNHKKLGIHDMQLTLATLKWDVIAERTTGATFGAVQAVSSSIANWQIKSVSGGKIIPYTVSGSAMTDGAVSTRHIQAESVNAEAIQAGAVTAGKIDTVSLTANDVEANLFKGAIAEITRGIFGSLEVDNLKVNETIEAALGKFLDLQTVGLNVSGTGVINHLVSSVFDLADGNVTGNILIRNLTVDQAQIMNATLMNTVILGDDGKYYKIHINDSSVELEDVTIGITDSTGNLILNANGNVVTPDGKESVVVLDELAVSDLQVTGKLNAIFGIFSYVYSSLIDTDKLFAREAFIQALRSAKIVGDKTLQMMTEDAEKALAAANSPVGGRNYILKSDSLANAYIAT